MAESLDAELNVDFDSALQGAQNLGDTIDTALSSSADGLEASLADIITNVPTLELETDTSAISTDIATAIDETNLDLPITADTDTLQAGLSEIENSIEPIDIPVEADTTSAQESLDQLGQSGSDAAQGVTDASNAQDLFASSTTAASGASALAVGNLSGLTNIAGRLHGNLGIVAASAAGFAATVGVLTHNGLEANATMQRFHAIVGDLAPRIDKINVAGLNTDLNSFAISLGTDDEALRDVVTDLVSYTKGAGFSKDATVEFEQNLVALAGRAVALKPSLGTVDQAAQKLIFGLAKGGPKVQAYNITLLQQDVINRALANTHKESARELTILEKAYAGSQLAIEKHGAAVKGDVLTGTKNLVIEERSLKEQLNNVIEAAGKPLAAGFLEAFKDSLPSVKVFASALGELAASVFPVLIDLLIVAAPILKGFAEVIDAIPTPLLAIGAGLLLFSKGLTPLTNAFKGIQTFAGTLTQELTLTGTAAATAGAEVALGGTEAAVGGEGFQAAGTGAALATPQLEVAGSAGFLAGEEIELGGVAAETGGEGFKVAASMQTAFAGLIAFTAAFTTTTLILNETPLGGWVKSAAHDIFGLGSGYEDADDALKDYETTAKDTAALHGGKLAAGFEKTIGKVYELSAATTGTITPSERLTAARLAFTDVLHQNAGAAYELALQSKEGSKLRNQEVSVLKQYVTEQNAAKVATDKAAAAQFDLSQTVDITTAGFQHATDAFGFWTAGVLGQLGLTGDELDALAKQTDDFANTIESAMKQATNPFEHQFPDGVEISEKAMEDFLVQSQLDAAAWVVEIKDLIERGVDKSIVDEIAQAGPKSKPQLDAFVKVVDEKGVEWVNSVAHASDDVVKETEDAYARMISTAAIKGAELAIVTKAATLDMATTGTKNLETLLTNTDETIRKAAYGAILSLHDTRQAAEDLDNIKDIELLIAVRAELSEDDQRLFDWLASVASSGGRATIEIPGGGTVDLAEGGVFAPTQGGTIARIGEAGHYEAVLSAGNTMAENAELLKRAGITLPAAPSVQHGNAPWWVQSGPKMVDNSVHTIVHAEGQNDPTRIGIEMARRQRAELSTRSG